MFFQKIFAIINTQLLFVETRHYCMKTLNELQEQYYEEFKGLPGYSPIIRNNQLNDAFELVVLKVLYGKFLPEFIKTNVAEIANYIIAPPDGGIDIFFQHESGDDYCFDVIQVKHTALEEKELRTAIIDMKRTIDDYCKNPASIKSDSCKSILSKSSLDKSNKNQCNYYIVHTGTIDDFSGSDENEHIITLDSLEIIYNNTSEFVTSDTLTINTSMQYGKIEDNHGAIVCIINGYDLAKLNNTYFSTDAGRNILFGSNLRESLITKTSKPFQSMSNTIIECPENFWYYNNGITIIAKDIELDSENPHQVHLKNFSIVNGAQTTSSCGLFLKEALKNNQTDYIKSLKKVFVLARILKVSDEKLRQDIAIYNNTQTPITSRDMVANRPEQKHLNQWLFNDEYPQIFVEIRRGSQIPSSFNKSISHRKTTNEELAQLAYASFLQKPFTAKDKKSALFNNDNNKDGFDLNKIYHDIFHWDGENEENNGIIFTKKKSEIDEALFIQQLYKEAKKAMKATLTERKERANASKMSEKNPDILRSIDDRIATLSLHLDVSGICMFYFIVLYYEFKVQFGDPNDIRMFNYDRYYSDKEFKKNLIDSVTNLFLTLTVKVLVKTATEANRTGNVNNWVRGQMCETKFFEALREELASDFDLEQKFNNFLDKYKTVK